MLTEIQNWKLNSIKNKANTGMEFLEKGEDRIEDVMDMIRELNICDSSKNEILETLSLVLVGNAHTRYLFKDISELIGG